MDSRLHVASHSLFNFFHKYKLNPKIKIYFNARYKHNGKWVISPVVEGRTYYTHYIPLDIPIKGYDRIVFSKSAIEFLLNSCEVESDLHKLRVKFYPWPMVILPSAKMMKSSRYSEADQIDSVYIRFGNKYSNLCYGIEENPLSFKKLYFNGFVRNHEYCEEAVPKKEGYRKRYYDYDDDYVEDYDTYLEKRYDAIMSGEDVVDDF